MLFSGKVCILLVAASVNEACATTVAGSTASFVELGSVERSKRSMARIMQNMTIDKAVDILTNSPHVPSALTAVIQEKFGTQKHLRAKSRHVQLRHMSKVTEKKSGQPGYSGVEAANTMLNDMIAVSQGKLDLERVKCDDFKKKQTKMIEEARQDIALNNQNAAAARAEILRANTEISAIDTNLPKTTGELKEHNSKCTMDLATLNSQLSIILADINVMQTVIEMSSCGDSASTALLQCHDKNHKDGKFITFGNKAVGKLAMNVKSTEVKKQIRDTLSESFERVKSHGKTIMLTQEEILNTPTIEDQLMVNQALNVTDPTPSPEERAKKCTIKGSTDCPRIQNKFIKIQAGIVEKKDSLMEEIAKMEKDCEDSRSNLEAQIADFETRYVEEQTNLAAGTKTMNVATENSRLKSIQMKALEAEYDKFMGDCETAITSFETEICGLKKIRTELNKVEGDTMAAFFEDCEVSDWTPEACSKTCGGGTKLLNRAILVHPHGGSECPPLTMEEPCNEDECPIDCVTNDWSEWSTCSATCGGGVKQKSRGVATDPAYGGKQCGELSETENCESGSCDADCVLTDWLGWTQCDKACDTGYQMRRKEVLEPPQGAGTCHPFWSPMMMEYKTCNEHRCGLLLNESKPLLECNSTIDLTIVLDGGESLTQQDWEEVKKFTGRLLQQMDSAVEAAVLVYSGPDNWNTIEKCLGINSNASEPFDTQTECMLDWVSHTTGDMDSIVSNLEGLEHPGGTTLTSLAMQFAINEFALGRDGAQSIVMVITDGEPNNMEYAAEKAEEIKNRARLVFVPVGWKAPVSEFEKWATQPVANNVIVVEDYMDIATDDSVNTIISNVCGIVD